MTKPFLLSCLAAPALMLLGGCGTDNRGMESVHQPVVNRTDYVFDVATAGNQLAVGEAARLGGWLHSLRVGYGDRVSVDDPAGTGAVDEVAIAAARYGLLLQQTAPVTAGDIAPGSLRVVVSRMSAGVPGCPDKSREYEPNFNAHTSSNFGCALNVNLAAMVANPEDLVRGQDADGTTDQQTSSRAIRAYRAKAPGTGTSGGGSATPPGGGQ